MDAAVEALHKNSKKVTCSEDIARVATISAGDETVGKLIAEAMEKVTSDGVITVEAVSYTHLDVYKRQVKQIGGADIGLFFRPDHLQASCKAFRYCDATAGIRYSKRLGRTDWKLFYPPKSLFCGPAFF